MLTRSTKQVTTLQNSYAFKKIHFLECRALALSALFRKFFSYSTISIASILSLVSIQMIGSSIPVAVSEEITEFGGYPARFKGDGDLEPPLCNVEAPKSASEPFFIKWNCTDNESGPDELRSEVWILRQGAQIPVKIADFLGFPASVLIEKGHLIDYATIGEDEIKRSEAATKPFDSYLPIGIRMLVRDRSGTSALSPVLTVIPGESSFSECSINLSTEARSATKEVTGVPSLSAVAPIVTVQTNGSLGENTVITSSEDFTFGVCEISSLCGSDGASSFFNFELTLKNEGQGDVVITSSDRRRSLTAALNSETRTTQSGAGISLNGKAELEGDTILVSVKCR
ncbi:MAG TPA: hypothetical protein PKA63_03170 [Oligoflexia bacterium]|nr:hypothetical protein [Oligoflexia bacterium]HMP47656.1 hypothetical protein [Oligoflexia bacterium]